MKNDTQKKKQLQLSNENCFSFTGPVVLRRPPQERRSHYKCSSSYSPVQQAQISAISCLPNLFCTQQIKPSPQALKT